MKNKRERKLWGRIVSRSIKIKNGTSDAKNRFADFFELPQEVIKNTTKLTIINNDNILIISIKPVNFNNLFIYSIIPYTLVKLITTSL